MAGTLILTIARLPIGTRAAGTEQLRKLLVLLLILLDLGAPCEMYPPQAFILGVNWHGHRGAFGSLQRSLEASLAWPHPECTEQLKVGLSLLVEFGEKVM